MSDASSTDSGRGLDLAAIRKGATITALVLAFIMPPIGLVLSIAAFIWGKRSGEGAKRAMSTPDPGISTARSGDTSPLRSIRSRSSGFCITSRLRG